jgi:uncharacterized protein (TIGR02246 family)
MQKVILGSICAAVISAVVCTAVAQQARPANRAKVAKADTKAAPDRSREADIKAIRAAADAFSKAYNAHDPKAIAALFSADGEIVDETGDAKQGRAEIEVVFTAVFEEYPEATMSVDIGAIRFLGANLAEEDGKVHVIHTPGDAPEQNRYTVLHLKQDGKWLMASARDLSDNEEDPAEQLKPLEWLIGDWVDESPDSLIKTTYVWTDNQAYILSEFRIQVAGREVMTGSQRIGWDPLAKVIRSWVFDSEGGFAEGVYSQDGDSPDGDRWLVRLTGVTRDGEPASATNVLTSLGKDRMSWQSRDRSIGGKTTPDTDVYIVVRPPPTAE